MIAKEKAPKKYRDYRNLIVAEMNKSDVDMLEAAINLTAQINDPVTHLWLLGVAGIMIEEKGDIVL